MVTAKEISVVISGPVFEGKDGQVGFTEHACQSVREHMPDAEIVLSTWKGTDCQGIDYDILVLNDDPGSNVNNLNRQICSRRAGILHATRQYILAIRSESVIKNLNFLNYVDKYDLHGEQYVFLKNRIVIPGAIPLRSGELFSIRDWYFFGHAEDILSLWDIPYMNDALYNNEKEDLIYNAHRYLITAFVRKFYPLTFLKKSDITKSNKEIYERVIAENFVIADFYEFGIRSLKYPRDGAGSFRDRLYHKEVEYTYNEWKELYNRYCGGKEKIHKTFEEMFLIYICIPLKRNHIVRLIVKAMRSCIRKIKKK